MQYKKLRKSVSAEIVYGLRPDNQWEQVDFVPPASRPMPQEHSARLINPGDCEPDSFRRTNNKFGDGIHAIFAKKKGEDSMSVQAIRFSKDKFSVAEAKSWLVEHKYKPILFEPASEEAAVEPDATKMMHGPVPMHDMPMMSGEMAEKWDASEAVKRMQKHAGVDIDEPSEAAWNKYAQGFGYVKGDGGKLGDYSLPHHDVVDGKMMTHPKGVSAAMAALHGARQGDGKSMDMSDEDMKTVEAHLKKHQDAMSDDSDGKSVGVVYRVVDTESDDALKACVICGEPSVVVSFCDIEEHGLKDGARHVVPGRKYALCQKHNDKIIEHVKSGRVLSKKNESTLRDATEKLESATQSIRGVLESVEPAPEPERDLTLEEQLNRSAEILATGDCERWEREFERIICKNREHRTRARCSAFWKELGTRV